MRGWSGADQGRHPPGQGNAGQWPAMPVRGDQNFALSEIQ
ncbi:hypothetical protein STRNTR1_0452 [Stenotrophomonas maltophilia]|nr:hypothetical protein STRNTR1_0452 [Stenotrophomonas maltophilia]